MLHFFFFFFKCKLKLMGFIRSLYFTALFYVAEHGRGNYDSCFTLFSHLSPVHLLNKRWFKLHAWHLRSKSYVRCFLCLDLAKFTPNESKQTQNDLQVEGIQPRMICKQYQMLVCYMKLNMKKIMIKWGPSNDFRRSER